MKNLFINICLLFLIVACSKKPQHKQSTEITGEWPVFRGDQQLSGIAPGKLTDNPILKWSFATQNDIVSTPVIGQGKVYITSTDGILYALNARTGKRVWSFDAGDDFEASALFVDNVVYAASLNETLYAFDAQTGVLKWQYKIEGEIYGAPNYARVDGKTYILFGSYDYFVYCIDAETSELVWQYETDNYINGSIATNNDVVIFGGCDEMLRVLDIATGTEKGAVNAGSYIPSSAAFYKEYAYLGHFGAQVLCINTSTQQIEWTFEPQDGDAFFSIPAVDKKHIVIGCRNGSVYALDRETGDQLWEFKTLRDVDSSPVICDDKVIVGSLDGRVYMIDLQTGEKIWSFEIGDKITGSPAVVDGYIFIASEDGSLYTFGSQE